MTTGRRGRSRAKSKSAPICVLLKCSQPAVPGEVFCAEHLDEAAGPPGIQEPELEARLQAELGPMVEERPSGRDIKRRPVPRQLPPAEVGETPGEKALARHMRGLPTSERQLHVYLPDEKPDLLDSEPDDYRPMVEFFLVEIDFEADWLLSATVYRVDDRLVVGRLNIEPNIVRHPTRPPAAAIGSAFLRRIRVGELLTRALQWISQRPEELRLIRGAFVDLVDETEEKRAQTAADHVGGQKRKRGRPPKADAFYAEVALAYLELQAQGFERRIIVELAALLEQRLGKPVQVDTARDWARIARRREFLSGGTKGRGGAEPGPRLLELLEQKVETEPTPNTERGR